MDPHPLPLSPRMVDVLKLLAAGYTYHDCASALYLSEGTIKGHVYRAVKRLDARTVTQAVVIYVTNRENSA